MNLNQVRALLAAMESRASAVRTGGPSMFGRLEEASQADVEPLLAAVRAALDLVDELTVRGASSGLNDLGNELGTRMTEALEGKLK